MNRRTARGNRTGLALVGVLLAGAGTAAILRGASVAPEVLGAAGLPILDPPTRELADQAWFWGALAAILVVIGLLALRWLLVQTRTDAIRSIRLETDTRRGGTTLPARAVTGALQEDLADCPQLQKVQATLTRGPALHLTLTLPAAAEPIGTAGDVSAAKRRLAQALARHRQALEVDDLPTVVQVRVARH